MCKSRQFYKANYLTYVRDVIVCPVTPPACDIRDIKYVYRLFLKIILKVSMANCDEGEPKYFTYL